jgi:hypothetical protein
MLTIIISTIIIALIVITYKNAMQSIDKIGEDQSDIDHYIEEQYVISVNKLEELYAEEEPIDDNIMDYEEACVWYQEQMAMEVENADIEEIN